MKSESPQRRLLHDIRNPLNAALGISDILATDASLSASQKHKVRVLKSSIEELHKILENALNGEQPSAVAANDTATPTAKPKTILLVEDYPPNALVMTAQLQQLEHVYDIAATGKEALEKFLSKGYDVILMDIQLPDIDGLEVTRQIRAIEKNEGRQPISILAISGLPEEKEDFIRLGMTDCLTKPIGLDQLKEKLDFY
jgi:CheY-like chemotaxis protein